ncbi:MAG: glycoside hydrolase family 32 protein [Planctomycetaceae bacterium]|nr:glycoside hydrolase family 32 protein [Planctomycetaceae bacterium]
MEHVRLTFLRAFQQLLPLCLLLMTTATATAWPRADDLLIADFESDSYDGWQVTGEAFGPGPAAGTLARQNEVAGYRGSRLVNTFFQGDQTTGTATSPAFRIQRSHIAFLIGGGRSDSMGMQLIVDGTVVRSATGTESEALEWDSWNVAELQGQQATLRLFDEATGGWGHLCVDHIIQTEQPPEGNDPAVQLREYRRSPQYFQERLRPQFHFSPEINWMNDPNGLVYHNGEYHLFHQYNPFGNSWGHMSWGHAVSKDLVHWTHLPLALAETDGVMAFSGCCVIDHHNSSGFGTEDNPPMVAIYTGHGHGKQVQNLACSLDNGRTWTMHEGNPVLDLKATDFRDPKVFWHKQTQRWVMVVSLAVEKVLVFYGSPDLKNWTELSRFGPAGTINKPNWECPDLFELPVEGAPGETRWVLEADIGSGSIAGGSGGEYFVGTFDGTRFQTEQDAQWVDFGRDFYAPISWDNIPASDGRRIWLGWMNNWETCLVPTHPWRSCMSVPRTLSLRKLSFNAEEPPRYVLVQKPVRELQALRQAAIVPEAVPAAWPPVDVVRPGELADLPLEIEATLQPGTARSVGLRIVTGDQQYLEVGYDRHSAGVYVDRSRSGDVDFHPAFSGRHVAPARLINERIQLQILVDRSCVEVFINEGEAVISDRFFPSAISPVIRVFAGDDSAAIHDLKIHRLRSIWRQHP